MRDQRVSAESSAVGPGIADRSDKAKSMSVAMLLIGLALLWSVPLGGALFVAAGGLGLAMTVEGEGSLRRVGVLRGPHRTASCGEKR